MGLKREIVESPKEVCGIKVVNDIVSAVKELKKDKSIVRYERGNSLAPIINDGEYCIVQPISDVSEIKSGDVVLCEVNGHLMTHMVHIVSSANCNKPYFLIGSSDLYMYGWTDKVYGIAFGTNVFEK